MVGEVLVRLPHADGVAAVVLDARGEAWLVDDLDRGGGTGLVGHRPAVVGVAAEVTLVGGLLPPGAVRAVVADRAGHEDEAVCGRQAWLTLLAEPIGHAPPIVRFVDAAGELVAVPVPADVTVEPVDDADEPCPVCGAARWARVVAAAPGRYPTDGADRPTAAVCRHCGHEAHLATLLVVTSDESPPDSDARAEIGAQSARELTAVARLASFALYGLAGRRPTVAGMGAHRELDAVTLAFTTPAGQVSVETSVMAPLATPAWLARDALERLLWEPGSAPPSGSETAMSLRFYGRARSHAATAASAPITEVALPVDGESTTFVTAAAGDRFAAVARRDDATITITGHGGPAGLVLQTLTPASL